MAHIGIRDLTRHASKVLEEVESSRRPTLVTRHGKPVAALVPVDDEALEDFILATAPEFVDDRTVAEREYAAGETVELDAALADLDS